MNNIEKIEIELLLRAIHEKYGYDFTNYARASLNRRIRQVRKEINVESISDLIPLVLHDEQIIDKILKLFSITVTEMFRDSEVFLSIRKNVIPYMKTFPFIKIWHAGCATGEEVYSSAIILNEENIYDRCTIYATDFNKVALDVAKNGIYELNDFREYTNNYQKAGGLNSFSDYYHAKYNSAIMDNGLKENIVFAHHNLTSDSVFSETHLVICRNVMIYFNQELQNRVLELFTESLLINGFLIIGNKESLDFSSVKNNYKVIDKKNRIYQKIR
ncbi:MAG: protein-glutamate O-methyltransferase CheR [Candidatus Cloacimonetes bacterium]|nr:protein-glutamate O-methyltransferase CheR [Candidatus Cloacimonadota bacterium]